MIALVFIVKILIVLAGGFAVFRVLRFPEKVDEGRVRSDDFYRTDHVSRETLERYRREVMR